MNPKGIKTFPRFIFLNFYAFLLLLCGIGIGVIPLYRTSLWLLVPQVIAVLVCLKGCIGIFSSWGQKVREYTVLYSRNEQGLRPNTFADYMQAPCGRLLALVVLRDLGKLSSYNELKKLRKPFAERLKEGCAGQPTVVTIYRRDEGGGEVH